MRTARSAITFIRYAQNQTTTITDSLIMCKQQSLIHSLRMKTTINDSFIKD